MGIIQKIKDLFFNVGRTERVLTVPDFRTTMSRAFEQAGRTPGAMETEELQDLQRMVQEVEVILEDTDHPLDDMIIRCTWQRGFIMQMSVSALVETE